MLEQDYIMRLVREFFEALELLLTSPKSLEAKTRKLREMYDQYVGPAAFYQTASMDDVVSSLATFKAEERVQRTEMLAELYYADAGLHTGPDRSQLLERALTLFRYVDRNSRTYSLGRLAKIADIERNLEEAGRQD